ncbi:MAG: hypothetical protein IPN34_14790 [Planctomycetes bacterium]|nr:hypothetical protein [Planctomycetota bacterium]
MLDASGDPLAEREWAGDVRMPNDSLRLDRSKSDAEGRVRWPLPPTTERANQLSLWAWSPSQSPSWIASRELPAPLARGLIELGDLRCAEIGVGVSGVVVDAAQAPIAEAYVSVQLSRTAGVGSLNAPHLSVRTDANGAFAVRVPEFLPLVDLSLQAATYTPVKLEALPSGKPESLGLRLVLHRAGLVRGTTKHDDPAMASMWRVGLFEGTGAPHELSFVGVDGSFAFGNLTGGKSYDLRFGIQAPTVAELQKHDSWGFHVVQTLTGFLVPEAGGDCADPRLKDIDLRGLLMQRRVRVLDVGGEPYRDRGRYQSVGIAQRSRDGELRSFRLAPDESGTCRWLGLAEVDSLTLAVEGCALETLEPGLAEQTVQLRRGLPIVIELAPDAPEIPAPFELWPQLRREEIPPLWIAAFAQTYLDFEGPMRNGRAEVFLPGPGIYRVHWTLQRDVGGGSLGGTGANVPRRDVIEVLDQPGVQTFRKAPHPDGVKAALRAFDRH